MRSNWQGKKTSKVPYPAIAGWVCSATACDIVIQGKARIDFALWQER